ncbi:MAG: WG repeat-containing protein [Candidatus Kapaibacterium sp.]|nr:MAG: WG repeat-containing protein [Candidatus Kapabacteria bacterium]
MYFLSDDEAIIKGGKWGFIDSTGKEIVPPKYDSLVFFEDGFALMQISTRRGKISIDAVEYWEDDSVVPQQKNNQ